MDIIKKRKDERKSNIDRITLGLKALIKKCGRNFPLNFDSIVLTIQSNLFCSRRTAIEYANLALFNVNMTQADLPYSSRGYDLRLEIPDSKKEVKNG